MLIIKNGKIHTMNKECEVLEGFSILIEDGKIKEINKEINKECEVIDAKGKFIYPGFIDAHSHIGLHESAIGKEGADINEATDPITPQLRAIDGIYPQDETLKEAYKKGVTSAVICPGSANIIGGLCSAIKLYGNRIDNMIIKENVAMKCAFGENPKRVYGNLSKSPTSRMAISAIFRETLFKTQEYMNKKESGKDISFDMKYEALIPVLKKELPLKVHAHREDDIFTAIRIAKEFDLNITLDHCTSGHNIAKELAMEKFPAIVGPSFGHRTKFELKDKSFKGPKILNEAGMKIAITTDSPVTPLEYLPLCAGLAASEGLDEYEALKAITINPAEIAGIDNRVGSIEINKDADIVITDKNPLKDLDYKVEYTIINGEIVYKK